MTKTFLFVGAGLEDPDLIFQLQEAVAEHGTAVGPHYALLPYWEAPQIRRDILRQSLNIEVIPVGSPKDARMPQQPGKDHWITRKTSEILRGLAGRVALRRFRPALPGDLTADDPTFCLQKSLRSLLRYAIEFTGSYRGDICLSPDGLGSHLSGELIYKISEGPTGGETTGNKVAANSICGIAYYQATTEYGVYVGDVNAKDFAAKIQRSSGLGHFGEIKYLRGDQAVRSELALPIEADGVRVGVLNLESNLVNAYGDYPEVEDGKVNLDSRLWNDDYLRVARGLAEKAGRLYAASHERTRRSTRLSADKMESAYGQMLEICKRLWCIARNKPYPYDSSLAADL